MDAEILRVIIIAVTAVIITVIIAYAAITCSRIAASIQMDRDRANVKLIEKLAMQRRTFYTIRPEEQANGTGKEQ